MSSQSTPSEGKQQTAIRCKRMFLALSMINVYGILEIIMQSSMAVQRVLQKDILSYPLYFANIPIINNANHTATDGRGGKAHEASSASADGDTTTRKINGDEIFFVVDDFTKSRRNHYSGTSSSSSACLKVCSLFRNIKTKPFLHVARCILIYI